MGGLSPDNIEFTQNKDIIRAAAFLIADIALDVIEEDPHSWSSRPCPTCKTVSSLIGRPFGCIKKAGGQ